MTKDRLQMPSRFLLAPQLLLLIVLVRMRGGRGSWGVRSIRLFLCGLSRVVVVRVHLRGLPTLFIDPNRLHCVLLIKPPRRYRQPRRGITSGFQNRRGMTARDKREGLGAMSLIAGFAFLLLGFSESYLLWQKSSTEKLALMIVEQEIAPWTFLGFVGVIVIAAGFLLILAESNKQAPRDLN